MRNCDRFKLPEERQEFWKEKLLKNKNRDMEKVKQLHDLGVRVLVIWECSLIGKKKIRKETIMTLIKTFLFTSYRAAEITPNGLTIIY